jgi:hypothetical protein
MSISLFLGFIRVLNYAAVIVLSLGFFSYVIIGSDTKKDLSKSLFIFLCISNFSKGFYLFKIQTFLDLKKH